MNSVVRKKYFNFFRLEISKFLADGEISDDEILRLNAEIENFKKHFDYSKLLPAQKESLENFKIHYDYKDLKKDHIIFLLILATFGIWGFVYKNRKNNIRIQAIRDFEDQLNSTELLFNI